MKPFEAGKTYKTRDGRSVRILCIDVNAPQPIAGQVLGNKWINQWYANGRYHDSFYSDLDLIPEPNTVTVWLTLYEKGVGNLSCSLQEADRWANKNGTSRIGKFLRIQEFTYEVES